MSLIFVPGLAFAGSTFKVGSFAKTTAAASVDQTVAHGLGVTPKAIILWTDRLTNESFGTDFHFAFGFTDGTTSKSVAAASQDNQGLAHTGRRMATKAITINQWSAALLAEADLKSWDSTNFTLTWTTNDATACTIHFIAIGGTDISAKVLEWTMGTSTGNKQVTGVGFKPDVVFHIHTDDSNSVPHANPNALLGLGVMDADGDQWATNFYSDDNAATSNAQRGQQTDGCIYNFDASLTVDRKASWVSMDSDGFTVNFTTTNGNASKMFSLALKGLNVKPGNFTKSTASATASQSVTGVGFTPKLVLLASFQDVSQASPVDHTRLGLGASDGTTQGCSAFQDTGGLSTTSVDSIDKTSMVFVKVNNNTPSIDAEAGLSSLDSGGFTLSWTTNDSVATQICYLALGSLSATDVRLESFTAKEARGKTVLEWRVGWEADSLGFHVWRSAARTPERITPDLVAGTALVFGPGLGIESGRSLAWIVESPPSGPVQYWLEEVDLSGKSTFHGPAKWVARMGNAGPLPCRSPLLASRLRPPAPVVRGGRRAAAPPAHRRVAPPRGDAGHDSELKLLVREEGWQRVAIADLLRAGLDPDIDPRHLRLCVEGREVSLRIFGMAPRKLDPEGYLEFYGTPLDTPWSDTEVYWLCLGERQSRRVPVFHGRGGDPAPSSFRFTVELKDRTAYFAALKNGDSENFFGPLLRQEPTAIDIEFSHLDPRPPSAASLEIALQGLTEVPHRVMVRLNGSDLGEIAFDGREWTEAEVPVPSGALFDGQNGLELSTKSGPADIALLDRIRLTAWRTYDADGASLRLSAPAGVKLSIGGFRTPSVRVFDITQPARPFRLAGHVTRSGQDYSVRVRVAGTGERTLLAVADEGLKEPQIDFVKRRFQPGDGADIVMISHEDFLASLGPLKALRESQGFSVAIVDVEQIYDAFGYGVKSPGAIREFLRSADADWRLRPRFVLLVGDATFDPRDHLRFGQTDFVPTKLVDTAILETASDDWFSDFDGDGIAEMAIGRLPVHTKGESDAVVAKLVGYDVPGGDEVWRRRVLFVADLNDGFDYFGATRDLEARVPGDMEVTEIFRGRFDNATTRAELHDALAYGQAVVNYAGHGSVETWRGNILTAADADGMGNGQRLPFFVTMDCLNGFFHDLYTRCLAERLVVASGGGAVAVWAPSSLTTPREQMAMDRALFERLFPSGGDRPAIGEAIVRAKRAIEDLDIQRTWILLGDPATRLR